MPGRPMISPACSFGYPNSQTAMLRFDSRRILEDSKDPSRLRFRSSNSGGRPQPWPWPCVLFPWPCVAEVHECGLEIEGGATGAWERRALMDWILTRVIDQSDSERRHEPFKGSRTPQTTMASRDGSILGRCSW